jgi:hypothetical protein
MSDKVNIEEAVHRLRYCPVDGALLVSYPGYPLARSCECGEFEIRDVWLDGDVSFEFKMTAPTPSIQKEAHAEEEDQPPGTAHD